MRIAIDPDSSVAPFEQLRSQFAALIATGHLAVGTRLPTIRQLANDLGVATGTIARAYRELEATGLVEAKGRHGTVVAAASSGAPATSTVSGLLADARTFLTAATASGLDVDDAIALLRLAARGPDTPTTNASGS